jgi:Uma2 family endonuclease
MVAKRHDPMTVEEFLALDRERLDQKYEFRNGYMVAMAGGSTNHTLIMANLSGILYAHLRKSPCAVLPEGTLKVENECCMPDVMVTCNEKDLTENKTYVEYPKLVIEILSPSNEKDDRVDKVWLYTQCFSIQEYVLVNWDIMLVQRMTRKGTEGLDQYQWIDTWYHQGENVELETVGLTIPVEDIYEKVTLPPLDPIRIFGKRKQPYQPN